CWSLRSAALLGDSSSQCRNLYSDRLDRGNAASQIRGSHGGIKQKIETRGLVRDLLAIGGGCGSGFFLPLLFFSRTLWVLFQPSPQIPASHASVRLPAFGNLLHLRRSR